MTLMSTRTPDRYPTRVPGAARLIERTDPTIWAQQDSGPIDQATLASHNAKATPSTTACSASTRCRRTGTSSSG